MRLWLVCGRVKGVGSVLVITQKCLREVRQVMHWNTAQITVSQEMVRENEESFVRVTCFVVTGAKRILAVPDTTPPNVWKCHSKERRYLHSISGNDESTSVAFGTYLYRWNQTPDFLLCWFKKSSCWGKIRLNDAAFSSALISHTLLLINRKPDSGLTGVDYVLYVVSLAQRFPTFFWLVSPFWNCSFLATLETF